MVIDEALAADDLESPFGQRQLSSSSNMKSIQGRNRMTRIVCLSQTEIEKETGIKDALRTPARGITRTELRDG